ncbi:hypothetical protein MKX03_018385 [Papaver bracteatum]|nr:hypothetical protein MKX03_018385 [Papaver bracteatum]
MFHSHGLQLHPKLGSDGKVRLCLLKKKKWNTDLSKSHILRPNKRILPRWICKNKSLPYNEETFKLSCEIMLEVMHNLPKDFEFLVGGPIQDDASSVCSTISDQYDSSTVPYYNSSLSNDSFIGSTIISSPKSRRRRKLSSTKVVTSKVITLKSKNSQGVIFLRDFIKHYHLKASPENNLYLLKLSPQNRRIFRGVT